MDGIGHLKGEVIVYKNLRLSLFSAVDLPPLKGLRAPTQ